MAEQPKTKRNPPPRNPVAVAAAAAKKAAKQQPSTFSRTAILLQLVVVVMAVAVAVIYRDRIFVQLTSVFSGAGSKPNHILPAQPIPRIKWNPDEPFATKFTASRMPVVLENSVASRWPAVGRWSPEYLAEKLDVLRGVYEHSQRVFTFYDPEKPLGKAKKVQQDLKASHAVINKSAKEFFDQATQALKGEPQTSFFYYSGPLEDFPPEIQSEIGPSVDWLSPQDGPNNSTSVWIGYNGTTAHTHYDIFWNFNVQLYGTKRFILYPPSQWSKLYHYPRLHPSYRQSQVDFDNVNVTKFPYFDELESFEIVVKSGDMLFIPPYWNHRVTSLDISVSVNVFSDAPELLTYYKIQQLPLDFIKPFSKTLEEAVHILRLYFKQIADAIMPAEKASKFMALLYKTRFEPLNDQLDPEQTIVFTHVCPANPRPRPMVQSAVKAPVKEAAALFKLIPKDIDVISFGNYIEDISRALLGPENVGPFIRDCLAFPKAT